MKCVDTSIHDDRHTEGLRNTCQPEDFHHRYDGGRSATVKEPRPETHAQQQDEQRDFRKSGLEDGRKIGRQTVVSFSRVSRFREGPRARLRRFAERLVASTSLHHDIAAVADADHNRAIARQVHWPRLHRTLDILATVNDDAHPNRSNHAQFDRDAPSSWTHRRRLRRRGARRHRCVPRCGYAFADDCRR